MGRWLAVVSGGLDRRKRFPADL